MSYLYDVFISYSSADRPWAIKLYDALRAKNIEPFLDRERLEVGRPWEPALAQNIQSSQHFVVLWSPHAERSSWVRREIGRFEAIVDTALSGQAKDDRRFIFLPLEGENSAYSSLQMIDDLREASAYAGGAEAVTPGLWQNVVQKIVTAIRADDPSMPLPVAVLAMTRDELERLDPNEQRLFGPDLNTLLHSLGIAGREGIVQYYGEQRTDWHPFGGPLNIRQLLDTLLENINYGLAPPFRWDYIDNAFWTNDLGAARAAKDKLLASLSVIVIDPLSLYEELVYQRLAFLHQCFASEKSVILVLTPFLIPPSFIQLSTLIEQRGSPFFDMYYNPPVPYDTGYATLGVNIGHERDIQRLLRTSLGLYLRSKSPRPAPAYLRS